MKKAKQNFNPYYDTKKAKPEPSRNISENKVSMTATKFKEEYGKWFGRSQEATVVMLQKEMKSMGRAFAYVEGGGLIVSPIKEENERSPYMVAHMDVVHSWNSSNATNEYELVVYSNDTHLWSPQGLGADDRFGIVAALEILKSCPEAGAIFTFDEEIGAVGAGKIATFCQKTEYLKDKVSFLVQVDRRGTSDAVFYDMDPDSVAEGSTDNYFIDFIENTMTEGGHRVREASGSFSDICELAPALGACAVNLSASYFSEHTLHETGDVKSLFSTIAAIKHLVSVEEAYIAWPYLEKTFAYNATSSTDWGGYDYGYNYSTFGNEVDYCEYCYNILPENTQPSSNGALLCASCEEAWGVK